MLFIVFLEVSFLARLWTSKITDCKYKRQATCALLPCLPLGQDRDFIPSTLRFLLLDPVLEKALPRVFFGDCWTHSNKAGWDGNDLKSLLQSVLTKYVCTLLAFVSLQAHTGEVTFSSSAMKREAGRGGPLQKKTTQ